MKIIPKRLIYNSKEMEHLLTERRVLAESASKHPFLTALEFAFQTDTHLYMVMEYAGKALSFKQSIVILFVLVYNSILTEMVFEIPYFYTHHKAKENLAPPGDLR